MLVFLLSKGNTFPGCAAASLENRLGIRGWIETPRDIDHFAEYARRRDSATHRLLLCMNNISYPNGMKRTGISSSGSSYIASTGISRFYACISIGERKVYI